MLVLWKAQRIGEGADALSHVAEDDATPLLACDPRLDRSDRVDYCTVVVRQA